MNVLWVAGVAMIVVVGILFLRRYSPEYAQLLPIVSVILLMLALLPQISDLLSAVRELGARAGMEESSLDPVLRGLGIGLITRFSAGVCYDCGQRTLGETVEYCGQIAIVSLALPMILSLAQRFAETEF